MSETETFGWSFSESANTRFTVLAGQARTVESYSVTNGNVVVDEPWTSAPANGDSFLLLTTHVHPVSEIADGVWNEARAGHVASGSFGEFTGDAAMRGTDGANTVVPLAAAVDQANADAALYLDGVFIDELNGTAGTGAGVGTRVTPSDNLTDALSIASTQNVERLVFVGAGNLITFSSANVGTANTIGARFFTESRTQVDFSATGAPFTLGGWMFDGPFTIDLTNTDSVGSTIFRDCVRVTIPATCLLQLTRFERCEVVGTIDRFTNFFNQNVSLIDCHTGSTGTLTVNGQNKTNPWNFRMVRFSGTAAMTGFTKATVETDADLNLLGGTITVDATNTEAARIRVTGIGDLSGAEAGNVQDDRYPTDQDFRDSMQLAPTTDTPAAASVDSALDTILNSTSARAIIDITTTPWQEIRYVYDEASAGDTVVHERFDLYDQDGVAIAGDESTGNNPLRVATVMIAERRRV